MKTQEKQITKDTDQKKGEGPKYQLNIEGELYPWNRDTITTEEIIELGGWNPAEGAMIIDLKTQEQRNLKPGEVIELKPGMGFSKKLKFKRG